MQAQKQMTIKRKKETDQRLKREERVTMKRLHLAVLQRLYSSYQAAGIRPADSVRMKRLRDKIYSMQTQLRVMGVDVIPGLTASGKAVTP